MIDPPVRREFLKSLAIVGLGVTNPINLLANGFINDAKISDFAKKLSPVGRILETEGYYVWCNSPIYDQEGNVHVFYSRWPDTYGMGGWIHKCEIAHAIAESPEKNFEFVETILKPRPGYFDATTCHNPTIHYLDGKYCLFYMGNSNGKTNTKRIGLATSDSLNGPWEFRTSHS